MCGIVGSLSWNVPPDARVIGRMNARLVHRGPDAEGVVVRGPVALGHRRLAIIDVSEASNQPMADHTGQFWIVFNGEIYNYREIRAILTSEGARFRSSGDTEVVLEAYKRWGLECLQRLNGMFAFALWDEARGRLFLARDRAGEKPLFYQPLDDGGIIFASELKALREHPALSHRINPRALGHYLSLNYLLTSESIIDGVRKLAAAHYLVVERGKTLRESRYWDLSQHFRNKRRYRSEDTAAEALSALIDDAVRLRLVSDVPLGAFLSGGIDSATIVGGMCRLRSPSENQAFTIGFTEKTYNEVPEARETARFFGVDHRTHVIEADMAKALPGITYHGDEPFADTSIIPVYYLAAFARQHVTVCLSGDGGDEIFAGYDTYLADKIHRATRWVPTWLTRGLQHGVDTLWPVSFNKVSIDYKLRQFLRGHPLDAPRAHYLWRTIFSDDEKLSLLRPEWRAAVAESDPFLHFRRYFDDVSDCHYLDQMMYVDIKTWLVDDILVKVDRATMAHSLESRAPFLDHRLIEFAASLPVEWKLNGWRKKHLLKLSQRGRLPSGLSRRRKVGFNAPVSRWFAGPLSEWARSATSSDEMAEWLDAREIERLWREHLVGRRDNGLKLFGLTCLGLWMKQLG
jgi:asparagine synthase (glutamine-hydrolysing)